jgi:TRAP-type C4-dicarboxylate transport system permease small subunit
MGKLIQHFDNLLEIISRWGIIICLFVILGSAVSSIVLRWLGMSPMWLEPMIRHLVFLSAFLGGSLATSKRVHIKIDLFTHFVNGSSSVVLKWMHRNLISLFCFVTTLVLMKASYDFFLVEKEYGTSSFLNIHSAYLVGIIPFGMGLICLRFFNQLIIGLVHGDLSDSHRL